MAKSLEQKNERSPEELARLRELREHFQREKPTIAELEAQGAEFATLGEVILLRTLANDLKQERERQRLTIEQLAAKLKMNPETCAAIDAGIVGKLSLGVLSRVAHALGKQISYSLVERVA